MGGLRLVLAVISVMTLVPSARADDLARWRPLIAEASSRFGLPAEWIARVMMAESRGRTHAGGRPIRSRVGAMGLMQLMPPTWAAMRSQLNLGLDPDNPRDNILAGAFYLRQMYDRFGYPGLFGAYNAGPARFAAVLAGRAAMPGETLAYLAMTATEIRGPSEKRRQPESRKIDGIFFSLSGR